MIVRDTARNNPAKKTSSNVRTLEDVKKDMEREKLTVHSLRDAIEDYDTGWDDDNTPGKRDSLEKRLKTAQDSYARYEQELEHHFGIHSVDGKRRIQYLSEPVGI